MSKAKILNETPVSISEVKKEIAKIKKRDEEINFRVGKTEDYVNLFTLTDAKVNEISKKIEELDIPRMKQAYIAKLIDVMPTNAEEVKSVLSGYGITITQENLKKIADTIKDIV